MQAERTFSPDWRDPAAYAVLVDADRSLFAWEWLRRNKSYRAAADTALSGGEGAAASARPEQFGLVAFEAADLAVPRARPLWRSLEHPYVLRVDPGGSGAADVFDFKSRQRFARVVQDKAGDHLLLSDGFRTIRLDAPTGTLTSGPVALRYSIDGVAAAERPLLTLRRFLALARTGRFSRSLHRRETRSGRWILLLRTWDALASGADQRGIAEQLLSHSVSEAGWRIREPSVRSQVQRLVRSARRLASGGYRELLS